MDGKLISSAFDIGGLHLKNRLVLAPMSGRTNLPFRLIIKKMGVSLVVTEMISAEGLSRDQDKTLRYLETDDKEAPVAAQIFGSDPEAMKISAEKLNQREIHAVDINMGCPAKKVVKTGSGASLMRDPKRAEKILSSVRKNTSLPVTAKIRAGWSPKQANAVDIAKMIEDAGADGVSLHPRFAVQGFSGKSDWSLISRVKRAVKIPVIGNGDINTPSDGLRMLRETGCDAVMIGRAALTNPWIFIQILDLEKNGCFSGPGPDEKYRLIMDHHHLLAKQMGELRATRMMRGFILLYLKGLPCARFLRRRISDMKGKESMVSILNEYFTHIKRKAINEG